MALKQTGRLLSLKTPLGADKLVLVSLEGREEISRLFKFQLELISDDNSIAAKDIVGKNITFSIKLLDDSERYFNGFVSRFYAGDEEHDRRNYSAEVVPWLWFLTRTADCRIFQNKTVPDIIQQVFSDLGATDFQLQLTGSHPKRDYCVQYRETDFNFVSRLMEEEGIYYYFKHEDGKHNLIIADNTNAYVDCVEQEVDYPADAGSRTIEDYVTTWEHQYYFRTGKWAQTDYNFETPKVNLMTNTKSIVALPGIDKYEVYDFPGEYGKSADGNALTRLRMEEEEVGFDTVNATGYCKSFTPGGKFKIRQHRSASEQGKTYVITSIQHTAFEPTSYETGASPPAHDYQNSFTSIPSSVIFRPERLTRMPIVHGLQTAEVVGPPGEEIFPDKYGRVKVQFHWDREGKKNEDSSCWVRVSQTHAGKSFGMINIPRIGEEVVIAFLEGNPDQPLIVGRVYHADNMPPFGLPGSKTICGMKSKTYKGSGYNEYVMDDTPGNELIREHGQFDKDSTILHDLREHVLHDRSRDVTNNETISIGVNRTETVGSNESLTVGKNRTESVGVNETLSVGSNRTRTVGGNETVTVSLMRTHTVGINEAITVGAAQEITIGGLQAITVGAVQTISVGASQAITVGSSQAVTVGASQTVTVSSNQTNSVGGNLSEKVGKDRSASVGGNDTLSSGKKISITAADEISLTTGDACIVMKKDGTITIKGKDITIQGAGQITAKASKDVVMKGNNILQN